MAALFDLFTQVPDPRAYRGRRYPLPAMLGQVVVAILAGHVSLNAITQFGRDHGSAFGHALGYYRGTTPGRDSFTHLFRRLDVDVFERLLLQWITTRHPDLSDRLALNGKILSGSADDMVPAVHLLTAVAPRVTAILQQIQVAVTTFDYRAVFRLLGVLPLGGKPALAHCSNST